MLNKKEEKQAPKLILKFLKSKNGVLFKPFYRGHNQTGNRHFKPYSEHSEANK